MVGKRSLLSPDLSHSLKKLLPCGRAASSEPKPLKDPAGLLKGMIEKLDAFVTRKRLNHSDARAKILETIVAEGRHFRVQDLVEKLQVHFPDEVGRSTVYRNLPIFVECGLLQEGPSAPDGEVLYELADDDHHDHIVCLDCRHIFEFHDEPIEERQALITKRLGLTVRDHRHVVYASCDRLNETNRNTHKKGRP